MPAAKILIFGTSLVGGGSVAAAILYATKSSSDSKISTFAEKLELPNEDTKVQKTKEAVVDNKPVVSYLVSNTSYTCRIFEVNGKTVNKVLREIKDQKGFMSEIGDSNIGFKQEVENACKKEGGKVSFEAESNVRHVYLYKDQNTKWIYSSSLQNKDWTKSTNFSEPLTS